ncbi:MAG: ATP-binding cassette domain-containing protein [Alphaproteobacteria bacterium]|nr:MAG: ATP-binding cassette domain-containing protein [Alphaproteobacteria bacterium]
MVDPVLRLSHIAKRFGSTRAVADISLEAHPGEILGFLGPNGAGKTTAIKIALGILRPDAGTRAVFGDPEPLNQTRRIGYLPEERGLYKSMTPEGVLTHLGALKGLPLREARRRGRRLLAEVGLGDAGRRKIAKLSKGMAQKVQVLAAIIHEPELLVLDEPFSGLDPANQRALEELITRQRAAGRTVIFSTHVMEHAERLCDRIVLVAHGRVLFSGTVAEARARLGLRLNLVLDGPLSDGPRLPGVESVYSESAGDATSVRITLAPGAPAGPVLQAIMACGREIRDLDVIRPSLHEVFLALVDEAEEADAVRGKNRA